MTDPERRDDAGAATTSTSGPAPDGPPDAPHGRHAGAHVAGTLARWVGGLLALLVVGVVAAVLVLTNTDWGREQLRQRVVSALANTVHGRFRVGRISGNLLKGLTLHDVAIADSAGAPFLAVDSAKVRYGLRSFFSKKIELSDLTLWRPVVVLDRPPGGEWNWARIFPSDTTKKDTSTAPGWGDWLVFRDARVVNGQITVRTPWAPADSLGAAQRDSAVLAALDTTARALTVRVPGGFQRVQEYRSLTGRFPLIRIAHPDYATRRVEVDSLALVALPFRPPAAVVRQAQGALEINADSLWFRRIDAVLPGSRASLGGRYDLNTGALTLAGRADPAALPDLRFILPNLPDGTARTGLAIAMSDSVQSFRFNDLDLRAGTATARGTVGIALGDTLRFAGTNVTFAGVDTRLIEQLAPTVDLPRRGVFSGRVAADGTVQRLALDGDVTFDDASAGRSRVRASGELGASEGVFTARGLQVTLDQVQLALARAAAPTLPVGGVLSGRATLDGSTATAMRATNVDLTHADRGARSHVTGAVSVALASQAQRDAGASALRNVDADLRLDPLALATVGRFAPAAGLRGTLAGPVRVNGTLDALAVNADLRLAGGGRSGGRVAARGRLDLAGTLGYDLTLDTRALDAGAVTTKAPATDLTGRLAAQGRGTDPATMVASLRADLAGLRVDTIGVDTLRARVRVARGLLRVDTLAIRAPRAAADALGTFGLVRGRTGELTYRVAVDSLGAFRNFFPRDTGAVPPRPAINAARAAAARADSAARAQRQLAAIAAGDAAPPTVTVDSVPPLPRDSVSGAVYAAGTLQGNIEGFDLRGRAGTTDLVLLGNQVARARVAYNWIGAMRPDAALAVAAVADSVRAGGFALDSVDARATWRKPGGTAQVSVWQDVGRSYNVGADYAVYPDRREARFGEMRLRFDTTVWTASRPGTVRWGQPGIEVRDLELLNGRGGRIYADGTLPTAGRADFRAQVRNFELGDLLGLVESDVPMRGRISLDAAVTGTSRAPLIRATASLDSADYRGTAVPSTSITADYAAGRLAADATATENGRRVLVAEGAVPINLALQGVTGPRLAENAAVTATARLDSLPLDLAERFTDAVSQVRGAANGTLSVSGSVRQPTFTGELRVGDARMRVVPLGITLDRLAAAIRLRGDTVIIDSVAGSSQGRIRLAGGVGIREPARPSFDLRLTADRARLLDNDQGRVNANAQVAVYGPFEAVNVSGGARVLGGVLYIPESEPTETLSSGDPAVFAVLDTTRAGNPDVVPAQSPLLANLRMDLFLGIDRDTWVRSTAGNDANIEIYSDGDLRLRVDRARQALAIDGVINTDRGEYTFLSKRFQVKRGQVTFLGGQDINPSLQIAAEYDVRQAASAPLAIRILIGGSLQQPRITLESDAQPPIPQSDLLSYLAFGQTSGSLLQFGGSSIAGQDASRGLVGNAAALATTQLTSVAIGVLANDFERRTARSLGADVFNVTPSPDLAPEVARADVSGIQRVLLGTQFEFGKYFNRQLFVGLQATPLFFNANPPIPGFRVQYRFASMPGLSVESAWQPRYFAPLPSLSAQDVVQRNSLGLFLVRQWRF